jgi:hypothetical protein
MKTFGIAIICGILGGLLGLMFGTGQSRYYKQSEQGTSLPILAIGGFLFGVVGGVVIGTKIAEDDKLEEKYGFKTIATYESKFGRKWILESKWDNPGTGNKNSIITKYSTPHNTVITTLNDEIIFNHQSTSGAKNFIEKVHSQSVTEIRNKIKTESLKLI